MDDVMSFSDERNNTYCIQSTNEPLNAYCAELNRAFVIKEIKTDDLEIVDFLFTLGCYAGEEITIISRLSGIVVLSVKDARYSIDAELAKAIVFYT